MQRATSASLDHGWAEGGATHLLVRAMNFLRNEIAHIGGACAPRSKMSEIEHFLGEISGKIAGLWWSSSLRAMRSGATGFTNKSVYLQVLRGTERER